MSDARLALSEVRKTFEQAGRKLEILRGISFALEKAEMVALVGPSGAGKSTLLHIAGLLEHPDSGTILVAGHSVGRLSDRERTTIRRETIGFVYQYHHLLPEFTAEENLIIPQMLAGKSRRAAKERADELLDAVGLADRLDHRPARLSGGEQQRVAIARAIANRPMVILADEPTGNLDPETADRVFQMLAKLVRDSGVAALVATHNLELAARMDRALKLEDGHVVPI
jgi:lipoprotein-releasing system ATP-binding protein